MNWRQRLGAFIGGFDAGQHHRRLRGFQATRAHVNALIAASGPDITARARWLVRNNGYVISSSLLNVMLPDVQSMTGRRGVDLHNKLHIIGVIRNTGNE